MRKYFILRFFALLILVLTVLNPSVADAETKIVFEEDGIWSRPISDEEMCVSLYKESPFELNLIADCVIAGTSLAGYITALVLKVTMDLPDFNGTLYDKNSVAAIDRWAMRPYNKVLDDLGTVTCALDLGLIPLVVYGGEFLMKNLPKKDGIAVTVMYLESVLLSQTIKDFMKISVLRARPYMYFSDYDASAIKYHDFEFSMPSGHTMNAFMSATFMTYTFCTYYPESKWRIPVIATSYAIALGTGALRMASGNHFFTDVLAGAGIGAACGFLVPFAHTFFGGLNKSLAGKTGKVDVEFAALPNGLNVSMRF